MAPVRTLGQPYPFIASLLVFVCWTVGERAPDNLLKAVTKPQCLLAETRVGNGAFRPRGCTGFCSLPPLPSVLPCSLLGEGESVAVLEGREPLRRLLQTRNVLPSGHASSWADRWPCDHCIGSSTCPARALALSAPRSPSETAFDVAVRPFASWLPPFCCRTLSEIPLWPNVLRGPWFSSSSAWLCPWPLLLSPGWSSFSPSRRRLSCLWEG